MLAHTGGCTRPVRLKGTAHRADPDTGELSLTYESAREPDGVLLEARQSRRATRCPACAATYRSDARALVRAGLIGGKGIPEDVTGHPLVFATITGPSFGPVHTDTRLCHPRPYRCPCGQEDVSDETHEAGDARLGRPLCAEGYHYPGVVIWNNRVTELWRRTTCCTRRHPAGLLGTTVRAFDQSHRLAYIKVVEYRTRGLIHLHALLRLDPVTAIEAQSDSAMLAAAVHAAIAQASAPNPLPGFLPIRWGDRNQVDVVAVDGRQRLPGYLGQVHRQVDRLRRPSRPSAHTRRELPALAVDDHLRWLVKTCWDLGTDPRLADCRLRKWAHTLGFRGHWLTKSPNWSTSLTPLRRARHDYQLERAGPRDDGIPMADRTYAGSGHQCG